MNQHVKYLARMSFISPSQSYYTAGADPENELGESLSGVQGRSPGRGSGGRSPPEADDFSQLKGYLDVTPGILGGMAPLPPPLKSARVKNHRHFPKVLKLTTGISFLTVIFN